MARWAWVGVCRGFILQSDGRTFTAGDLMRVKVNEARAWSPSTVPVRPCLARRVAYALARTARLVAGAMGETSAVRRRAAQRKRRAAESVRRRAIVVKVVRR